nr:unnamed protein product [Digitaria exilis]
MAASKPICSLLAAASASTSAAANSLSPLLRTDPTCRRRLPQVPRRLPGLRRRAGLQPPRRPDIWVASGPTLAAAVRTRAPPPPTPRRR